MQNGRFVLIAAISLLPLMPGPTRRVARADGTGDSEEKSPTPKINLHYPKDGGTVFSLPHVLLIFDVEKAAFNPNRVAVEIDGRPVPRDAIQGCALCAGPRPALMAQKVLWALTEGTHKAAVTVRPPDGPEVRKEITYTVDTTVPSLSGLTGFVDFPDAQVATSKSLRGGIVQDGFRENDIKLWLVATRLFEEEATIAWARPFEAGVTAKFPDKGSQEVKYSAKIALQEQSGKNPSVSIGLRENDPFLAAGWHHNPSTLNFSAGVGGKRLPGGFAGVSWGPEIFRAVAEYGTEGQLNYGLVLYHPYGLRAGVYHVERSHNDNRWVVQLSASLGF